MKKFLSFLTAMTFVTTSVTSTISCQKPKEELTKENVHKKIKEVLSEPLEFNDDWIIDYDKISEKSSKEFVSLLAYPNAWTYLTKTVSYLALERLKSKLPNLFKIFPDFTLSSGIYTYDSEKIETALLNHEEANFHYNFYYNLNQMQNFDFSNWIYVDKGRGLMGRFNGIGGEFHFLSKENSNLQVNFKQKQFIINDQKRLNYLTKILNATPSIKFSNENYRTFVLMGSSISWVGRVKFKKTNFPNADLVERLHNNPKTFLGLANVIKSNLNENMTSMNYSNATDLQNVIKKMPTIFDDIDFDIELVKSYLNSEIEKDETLNNVYGSLTFPNGMLLLKIKTKLISNGITSTNSIDEVIALDIKYKESEKD